MKRCARISSCRQPSRRTTATRGRTAWINHADAVFDSFEIYVEEIIDVGDQLVVVTHERATGKGSGLPVDQRLTHIWTIRNGQVATIRSFTDRAEALSG